MNLKKFIPNSYFLINQSRYLWFLIIAYSMVLVSANWSEPRLIKFFWIETGAGALIFPVTYVLADIITEVYGYKNARLAVWMGLLFNATFLLYGQMVGLLPSPDESKNTSLDQFLHLNTRIILASAISYLVTEPLNSYFVAKLKILFAGQYMGLRFLIATLCAHALNIITFGTIAFYNTMSLTSFLHFLVSSWLFMVLIELVFLPISVRLSILIKKVEQLDIYDRKTQFNLFKLNSEYQKSDNEFS